MRGILAQLGASASQSLIRLHGAFIRVVVQVAWAVWIFVTKGIPERLADPMKGSIRVLQQGLPGLCERVWRTLGQPFKVWRFRVFLEIQGFHGAFLGFLQTLKP